MITANHLKGAPIVATVTSFVAVFALGYSVHPGPVNTVSETREHGVAHVDLGIVQPGTTFAEHRLRPLLVRDDKRLELCVNVPDGERVLGHGRWTWWGDRRGELYCTEVSPGTPVQVDLVRK